MTNPTPGPWTAVDQKVLGPHTVSVAWCHESAVYGCDGSYVIGVSEAKDNARLIAAAPDLLDALRGIVALWDHHASAHGDGVIYPLHKAAKSAIAKATGEGA
jgi:cytochrome c peroxidase